MAETVRFGRTMRGDPHACFQDRRIRPDSATSPNLVPEERIALSRGDPQRVLRPPCLLFHHSGKLVRRAGFAPAWAFARQALDLLCLLFHHNREKWSIHRDVRPARRLTKAVRRYLRLGCMVRRVGLAPTKPRGAAHLQCAAFAAPPSPETLGLRWDSHPRPSPYEGAALTCCATEP
jgi:hypothetical protein